MNLRMTGGVLDRRLSSVRLSWACLCVVLLCFAFLCCAGSEQANAQAEADASLADTLAHASQSAGPAPAKNSIPFLITRVVPQRGDDACYVEAVTNGMSYDLFADGAAGCRHLPDYHAIAWGHHGGHLNKDAIELVYSKPGEEVKTATYFIRRSIPISADWTEDQ